MHFNKQNLKYCRLPLSPIKQYIIRKIRGKNNFQWKCTFAGTSTVTDSKASLLHVAPDRRSACFFHGLLNRLNQLTRLQGCFDPLESRNKLNPKNGKEYTLDFIVFRDNFTPLLGLKASEQMNLICALKTLTALPS